MSRVRFTEIGLCALVAGLFIGVFQGLPAAAATTSSAKAKAEVLHVSDLPTGWTTQAFSKGAVKAPCAGPITFQNLTTKGASGATAAFSNAGTQPVVEELVEVGNPTAAYNSINKVLAKCGSFTLHQNGATAHGTIRTLSFPKYGDKSKSVVVTLTSQGNSQYFDALLVRSGQSVAYLVYGNQLPPQSALVEPIFSTAVEKLG